MTTRQIANGLKQLGFNSGWVISGDEIILWEHDAAQPTQDELKNAAALWEQNQAKAQAEAEADKAALLAKLGITADEAKLLLS